MSKRACSEPFDSESKIPKHSMQKDWNWELCVLCQTKKQESDEKKMTCPFRSKKPDKHAGYTSLVHDLLAFAELGHLSSDLEHVCNVEKLIECKGSWHGTCRAKYKKEKLQRIKDSAHPEKVDGGKPSTRSSFNSPASAEVCFFCELSATKYGPPLFEVCTKEVDEKVRLAAIKMEDTKLLAKLAAGDMIAIEAKYHCRCLVRYYNRARSTQEEDEDATTRKHLHGIAFAELVSYIEEHGQSEEPVVFKLAELAKLYNARLVQLGATNEKVHSTRLKERLLGALPELTAHTKGKEVYISFAEDLVDALKRTYDDEGLNMMRAAKFIRQEIFSKSYTFDGNFDAQCQEKSVSPTLLAFVSMLLDGTDITEKETPVKTSCARAATIAQLITFNAVKTTREKTSSIRHNKSRETPLTIYTA